MLRGQDDESQEAKRPRRRETRGQEAKKIRDKRLVGDGKRPTEEEINRQSVGQRLTIN